MEMIPGFRIISRTLDKPVMKPCGILLIAFISTALPACACIWVEGTTIHGEKGRIGRHHTPAEILRKAMDQDGPALFEFVDRHGPRTTREDFSERERQGVDAILDGDHEAAVRLFLQNEEKHPGGYSTAANLGTSYELLGDLENATTWIAEGIRRKPESHYGTEWLHLEILKTRMKLATDPTYLEHNHIITLPANFSPEMKFVINGKEYDLEQVRKALEYQLGERMIFVKPRDAVVADLLFSFGVLEGRTRIVESGLGVLELARTYGYPDTPALDREITRYESVLRSRKLRQQVFFSAAASIPVALVAFLLIAWRKKWFFLTNGAHQRHLEKNATSEPGART